MAADSSAGFCTPPNGFKRENSAPKRILARWRVTGRPRGHSITTYFVVIGLIVWGVLGEKDYGGSISCHYSDNNWESSKHKFIQQIILS